MAYQVLVNDHYVELEPGQSVPVTRQINDIAEMVDRQGDYSQRLRAVLSDRNRDIFGFTDNPNSSDDKAYELLTGRIRGSAGSIIEDGVSRVLQVSDSIEFIINGSGYSFWSSIEGLSLHDIDWTDLDFEFTVVNVAAMATNTSGIVFPVVDYYGIGTAAANLDIRYTPGSIYIHTIVQRLVEAQGYTLAGAITADTFYLKKALPFSGNKWQHSDRYVDERAINKTLFGSQQFSDFSLTNATNKVSAKVQFGTPDYTSLDTQTLDISVTFNVSAFNKATPPGNNTDVKLALRVNGAVIFSQIIAATGSQTMIASGIPVVFGDVVDLAIVADFSISAGVSSYSLTIDSCNFYTPEINRDIDIGETLTAESILPDMNQKTFLKGILQMYALIPEVDEANKTITLRRFDEIYDNIPLAQDWSDKLVKPDGQDYYYQEKATRLGSYGQINYASFAQDELLNVENYGQGQINVEDASLAKTYNMFTLPFAASEPSDVFPTGERVAKIEFYEAGGTGDYTQEHSPKQRIIYIDDTGAGFNYTDGTTTTASSRAIYGKFIDREKTENLGFNNNLLSRYYSGVQKMLVQAKRFSVLMNLTAAEVAEFDFFVPVYLKQLGGVFYVNKFVNFIEGNLTKVEIVKL